LIFRTNVEIKESLSVYHLIMKFFCFLVFVLAIYCVISSASRRTRRRRRARRGAYNAIMQDRNLAIIRSSDSLNILGSDHYGYDGLYNRDICGYMETHVYINGTNRNLPVPTSVKEGFIREYFAKIYTPVNFPLTYRKEGVYIDGNSTNFDKVLSRYYYKHCVEPNFDEVSQLFLLIFLLFIIPAILFSGCGPRV